MRSFNLYMPTRMIFGRGRIGELSEIVGGYGRRALLTYGGGSVKKSGLHSRAVQILESAGIEWFELSGIEPNPKLSSVRAGAELCKKNGIDFIFSIGGGSVLDCSKGIAAGARYAGDPWDLVKNNALIKEALPIIDVITLAATGSEYDGCGVITNEETREKLSVKGGCLFPAVSVCDPEYTFTVSPWQTASGASDIMSHIFEQYLVSEGAALTDGICEAALRSVIENTPRALENPDDFEARAALLHASSFGCSGLFAMGCTPSPWPCHALEHEISAYYDVTHGAGLAVITPAWMRWTLTEETAPRFAQYGVRVWGLDPAAPAMETALRAIEKTEEFFKSIGMPSRLSGLDPRIDGKNFGEMAEHVLRVWGGGGKMKYAFRPLDREGLTAVLNMCL